MIIIDNEPSYAVERDDPMWRWVGSAHLPMDRKDLINQLRTRKHCCSSVVKLIFMYQVGGADWFADSKMYIMPNGMDNLVSDLAELSLTHTIVGINKSGFGIEVAVVESEDHTTNIDADLIDVMLNAYI